MSQQLLLVVFFALCAGGGVAALLLGDRASPRVLAWIGSAASLVMLGLGAVGLAGGSFQVRLWTLPPFGTLALSIDSLAGLFLLVAGLVFCLRRFIPPATWSTTVGISICRRCARATSGCWPQ